MFKGYRLKSEKEFSNSTLFFFGPTDWLWTWAKCSHKANRKNEALGAMHSPYAVGNYFPKICRKLFTFAHWQ